VLTLSDVVDPWSGILEGDYVSFFESEHEGKQVMFGIGGVIMMLDLRISGSVGDNFVRLSEVVIAVDMLLKKKSKLATSQCALNTLLVSEKRTLGILL
jgi:hypothetical protein